MKKCTGALLLLLRTALAFVSVGTEQTTTSAAFEDRLRQSSSERSEQKKGQRELDGLQEFEEH